MVSKAEVMAVIQETLPTDDRLWSVVGFINREKQILAFGDDAKIIGRLFEVAVVPYLEKVAAQVGCTLGQAKLQTVYPDFWLARPDGKRIAIDIKSTYRRFRKDGTMKPIEFTLGAYSSFLRNGTKNIDGHYTDYAAHLVIGFLYTRDANATVGATALSDIESITAAYKDVEFFVQEKHRIAGQYTGSRDTNNIGTIRAPSLAAFRNGRGYFSQLGEAVFEDYWRHYPVYRATEAEKKALYHTLPGYFAWLVRQGKEAESKRLAAQYAVWQAEPENGGIK
ncbi:type II restriction endonuclease [Schleiferilactobacillus shenzhenensis]|uniref:Restriction endonuclease n=1 Tax=Schleiferilactobacillus shenzhenensis LY-73 TaxID=1231336 RepID=U4TNG6_9LACO|nr:type II restriction endonuclease [Schleiferilactobacillus shenzhenensis]ERL65764.1 hypothetical protein L248_1840 [Schleiferilactobacillus shenzhenensis LY-73]